MSSQKESPAENASRVSQEKIKKDPGLRMQQYFDNSESPEKFFSKSMSSFIPASTGTPESTFAPRSRCRSSSSLMVNNSNQ